MTGESLRGYLDYLRDLGVYDLYRHGEVREDLTSRAVLESLTRSGSTPVAKAAKNLPLSSRTPAQGAREQMHVASTQPRVSAIPAANVHVPLHAARGPEIVITPPTQTVQQSPSDPSVFFEDAAPPERGPFAPLDMPLISFNELAPLPLERVSGSGKAAALVALREHIGDCTRCPLAYAGRHTIVFADGDPNADLMFVGEGPGADEDASGVPFVGKAGQLLNNMISAMGLKRESVYIANIVKCRPPKNRVPEPVEANTCSQFLVQQIDIVQPKVIVALGSTAATYLLGVKQSVANLRGQWHDVRGAKCAVTYHPAFLLRDPRQKGEAWKDLQRVMVELNLRPPARQ